MKKEARRLMISSSMAMLTLALSSSMLLGLGGDNPEFCFTQNPHNECIDLVETCQQCVDDEHPGPWVPDGCQGPNSQTVVCKLLEN